SARSIINPETERFVEHQLAVNRVYLELRQSSRAALSRWERPTIPLPDRTGVIPDGIAELQVDGERIAMFIEADRGSEGMSVWERKVRGYLNLARSGHSQRWFNIPSFRVLVVAPTEARIQAIRTVIARSTNKVFWLASTESINRAGFWDPVWQRPTG